ncbi:hypothetical protein SAMN05444412_103232 [Rhodonellum ikkaensis]|uniref:Uncharacterized protein n=1 Tax=Rhodonellum ikkaensis TaxID=336829 RepID=A0A1H3NFV9_9BACT|nr:hypothetical protein SAMN05444412_103232 [Rhodonellum ikkaensis]
MGLNLKENQTIGRTNSDTNRGQLKIANTQLITCQLQY